MSQWSERRNDSREWNKKSTFSPSDPTSAAVGVGGYSGRPDRVQVLPTGPDHTFKTSSSTAATNGGTRLYKTTSTHMVGGGGERGQSRRSPARSPARSPRGSPYRDDSDELNVSRVR